MSTTSPYYLRADYVSDGPVSAADLNRRAKVLSSQLPGALRASSLCEGVFPLWEPGESLENAALIADLLTAADACLAVTISGSDYTAAAGAANILHPSGALVYTQTHGLTAAVGFNDPEYVHLLLAQPLDPLSPGAIDAQIGGPPTLLVSDVESEPGAVLLASVSGGVLTDRRRFTAPVLLAVQFAALQAQFDALAVPVDPTGDGPTAAQFLALQSTVSTQGAEIAGLTAALAALQSASTDNFPSVEDQMADEIAINRAGLAEVNPPAVERGQISVVVANAGHGQNDTPDYTPTTGDALEMPFNIDEGTFGS